jgi:hypothetical protein
MRLFENEAIIKRFWNEVCSLKVKTYFKRETILESKLRWHFLEVLGEGSRNIKNGH